MDQWTFEDWGQFDLERITVYEGDSYLVVSLLDTDQYTPESARLEVQDATTLRGYLEYDMLPQILADRTACLALKDGIVAGNADLRGALADAAQQLRKPRKRGPRAKMASGQYLYERIVALRDQEGLTWPQIALRVYGKRSKAALVKASYYGAKKRTASGTPAKRPPR